MEGKLGENHSRQLHRENAEQKANRIICEELSRLGWKESDLTVRRRSDLGTVALAARLRKETTLPIKWIAARLQIGTAKGAKSALHRSGRGQHQHKPARVVFFAILIGLTAVPVFAQKREYKEAHVFVTAPATDTTPAQLLADCGRVATGGQIARRC